MNPGTWILRAPRFFASACNQSRREVREGASEIRLETVCTSMAWTRPRDDRARAGRSARPAGGAAQVSSAWAQVDVRLGARVRLTTTQAVPADDRNPRSAADELLLAVAGSVQHGGGSRHDDISTDALPQRRARVCGHVDRRKRVLCAMRQCAYRIATVWLIVRTVTIHHVFLCLSALRRVQPRMFNRM